MVNKLTILNVLDPFLVKPNEKLHLAEISRSIKEPHPTVRLWLNLLEKKGVLKKEFKGRLTLYSLNKEDYNVLSYLVIAEKNKLINKSEKNLILKEVLDYCFDINGLVLIFGSAAEDFNKAEDIDLLVVGKAGRINELEKKIGKEIHLINVNSLSKVSKSLKEEIIKKHLIIKGSEEIIRWMVW